MSHPQTTWSSCLGIKSTEKPGNKEGWGLCLSKVLIGENTQDVAKGTGWGMWLRWDGRVTEGS